MKETKPAVDLLDFEEKAAKSPGGPSSSGDLLDLMSSPGPGGALPSTGAAPVKKDDLLDLGFGEPPPPTDFTKEVATLPLPEQITLDLSKCEKGPIGPFG